MRLRYRAATPEAFATGCTYPRLIFCNTVTHVESGDRITPFELFEFQDPQPTTDPAIQLLQSPGTSQMAIVGYPARQGLVEASNHFRELPRLVTPGQSTNRVLKTGDTLPGQSKAPVVETGDSQESFFRSHGRPPISPGLHGVLVSPAGTGSHCP